MKFSATPSEIAAALSYEREKGKGDAHERAGKIANHLQERPDYYADLERRLAVPMHAKMSGPFIGPKGGLWADPQHTVHWDPAEHGRGTALPESEKHLKIKRIVGIRDTRERELVEGRLGVEYSRPIPGSGVLAVCARCAREHEVHAAVELTNGRHVIMGTGCAKKQDPEQASRIGTLERAAKALGKAAHELAQKRTALAELTAKNERGKAAVDKLTVPDLVDVDPGTVAEAWARSAMEQRGLRRVAIGDVQGWQHPASEMTSERYRRDEARRDVTLAWRQKRLAEQGVDEKAAHDLRGEVEHLEKRVKKLSAQREAAVREGLTKGQVFTGPQGGRWANPEHTIPYHEGTGTPGGAGPKPPPPKPSTPTQQGAQPKPLPSADMIGQQGMQVVASIRQHDPQLASQLEEALHHVVVGLRARQAGAKTPEGDSKIIENLKAFGRAFNSSAAPASVLGPDLGSLLEAAEKKNKREAADNEREAADALAAGREGIAQVSWGARTMAAAPDQPEHASPSAQPAAEPGAAAPEAQGPVGPDALGGDYQVPPQGADDGVLDVFGLGSPDEVNRQFGYDPQAQQVTEAAHAALGRLDEASRSETDRALADVRQGAGAEEQATQRAVQGQAERQGYDQSLAEAKQRKDTTERAAADAADRWASRQSGRRGSAVLRQQLGAPEQPEKVEISPERAAARTQAPKRKPKAEAPMERSITPTLLKAAIGGQPQPMPSIGPTYGAAPGQRASIPDYQSIYFQPPSDDRKRREEEAEAVRRQADADVSSRAHGFHGTGDVRLDPTLLYVPAVRTMAAVGGPQIAQRAPMVVADHARPRLQAGGPGMPVGQTDAGRVSRSPDPREDALAPSGPRPSPTDGSATSGTPGAVAPLPVVPVTVPQGREPDDEEEDEEDEETEKSQRALARIYHTLEKAGAGGAHKYIRRVPTGNPKRPWRYYYAESAIARDVQAGEEVSLGQGQGIAKVHEIAKDGTIHVELGGKVRAIKPDEWANLLVRGYGSRYHDWAEKRAEASVNAVLRHVPKGMLEDLEGSDEERLSQLQQRVPAVYAKLQQAFARAGVNPFRAKGILATALERRGWAPEARAAAVGAVLTKRTSATRFSEIVRGAESLAAGAQVTVGHVGTVVELRGGADAEKDDFADRVTEIAKRAEAELAKLSEALSKARDGSNSDRANALAMALASSAIQKLNLLTTAFPGLKDRVADEARGVMAAAPAAAPHAAPKSDGGETAVYVAGDGGQPKAIRAKYKLVNASEVVASHDPLKGFKKREDYPEGVQERAYHRDESEQAKVMRNAQILNPAFVANTNPDAVNGPPVVIEQNGKLIALGGNSRTMSMQRAYAHHEEKGASLKAYLSEHAHEFGLRPEDVEAVDQPVLVRVIEPDDTSPAAQRLLVRQLNESFTQGMDPRTLQVAMGRKLDEQSLASLGSDMKEDETLAAFLASTRSERFVNALQRAGIIDQRNANQYMKKGTKLLNEDGRVLVERILVGRVVGDADVLSNTGPKIVSNIAAAVPYMVQAKASGGKGYDVGGDLAVALSAYNDLHHRVETGALPALDPKMDPKTFDRLFNYFDSLFGDRHPVVDNKNARALLELLIRKPGPQQQAAVWRDYVRRAGQNPEGQATMFGPAKSPGDVLRETVSAALSRSDEKTPAGQRGLF